MPAKDWAEFKLHTYHHEGFYHLVFTRHDLRSPQAIRQLERDFALLVPELTLQHVVIDFSAVKLAPTAIFGIVLQLCADCKKRGMLVRVCCLDRPIRKAFELLNASGLVELCDTLKDAATAPWEAKKSWWPFGHKHKPAN